MAADLGVPLDGGGSLPKVQTPEERIGSVLFAHLQHGGLASALLFQGRAVREQIELEGAVVDAHVRGADAETAEQERVIRFRVKGGENPRKNPA